MVTEVLGWGLDGSGSAQVASAPDAEPDEDSPDQCTGGVLALVAPVWVPD